MDGSLQNLDAFAALPYGTPTIVCSVPGVSQAADSLGVTEYLVKPVPREKLLRALDEVDVHGGTVLVVDDEQDALRLFWRTLTSAGRGYKVLTASDGEQAMRILREQRPDAMLLDLVMPGMDGFRVLETKNAAPTLRDIPVIVISARDPGGQPIVSNTLTATRGGGLSTHQLLASIEALSKILGTAGWPADPVPTAARPG
jgi:CheY-like chemotaxis protein